MTPIHLEYSTPTHIRKAEATPLILLFGMPRSGTTWLGKIFDSHPDTLYRHEPDHRREADAPPLFISTRDAEYYRVVLEDYIVRLPEIRDEKVAASLPIFAKNYFSSSTLAMRKLAALTLKTASRLVGPVSMPRMGTLDHRGDFTLVWKSVESLGWVGALARLRPDARVFIILRHPCGHIASVRRGEAIRQFKDKMPSSEDWGVFGKLLALPQAQGFSPDAVKAMTGVERMALKWALYYEHALAETSGLANVFPVRYEDFCVNPLREARYAFELCGLPWSQSTERFIDLSTYQDNPNYYSVFKNPLKGVHKWRSELSPEEVRRVLEITRRFRAGSFYR